MPREKIVEPDTPEGVMARFFDKAGAMLRKWARAVSDWLDQWLRKLFRHPQTSSDSRTSGYGWIESLQILLYGLVAVVLAALAVLLYRVWRDRRAPAAVVSEPIQPVPDIHDENVGADQLPEDSWTKLARELLERGELRLALRAFYFASLAHLASRNLISIARFKSNRDYERELRRRGHSFPDLLPVFGDNLGSFERDLVWSARGQPRAGGPVRRQCGKDEGRRMKRCFPFLLLLGCAAGVRVRPVRLFQLRFEVGDVYPAYSTLRSDPLGTMAFYESLGKVPGFSSRRDFTTQNRLPEEPHTVYLQLAGSDYDWDWVPADLSRELEAFLARGNRLVITFFPQTSAHSNREDDDHETNSVKSARSRAKGEKMAPDNPTKKKKKTDDEDRGVDLTERWGFETGFIKLTPVNDIYEPARVVNQTDLPLPRTLNWHSGTVFTNLDGAWRVIYTRGTNAVLIERQFGKGSVVMATDSYFVSNEAMEKDRHADLLAWLVGANQNAVFDEAHFGVVETAGVAMLMRKYRLHGLVAGLLLLAGLFIWKNASSLVPPHAEEERRDCIAGKDSAAGFVNLLRRSIAPRDLLPVCFAEWKKSAGLAGQYSAPRRQQAEAAFQADNSLPPKDRNPIATCKKICSILGNPTIHHQNHEH